MLYSIKKNKFKHNTKVKKDNLKAAKDKSSHWKRIKGEYFIYRRPKL